MPQSITLALQCSLNHASVIRLPIAVNLAAMHARSTAFFNATRGKAHFMSTPVQNSTMRRNWSFWPALIRSKASFVEKRAPPPE